MSKKKRSLIERLNSGPVICAEGFLFEIEKRGYMASGEFVPMVSLEHPEALENLHRDFQHAGSDIVEAFTYNGHREKMKVIGKEELLEPLNRSALKIAKNTKYGLHASVFTQDIDRAFHLAKSLPCGTVSINSYSEGDIKVPFGGYKQSVSLSRDQGTEALNQYLQTKTIWISHS